mgnify:CR=1 FL=1
MSDLIYKRNRKRYLLLILPAFSFIHVYLSHTIAGRYISKCTYKLESYERDEAVCKIG